MPDIKTKIVKDKTVKTIDKAKAWTERVKDPIVYLNDKVNDQTEGNNTITEYGEDKIKYYSNRAKDEAIYNSKKVSNKTTNLIKDKYKKSKLLKEKNNTKDIIKTSKKTFKDSNKAIKNTKKVSKEAIERAKRVAEQGRKLAIETTKKTVQLTKVVVKAVVSGIKAIIQALSSLIGALLAGSTVALIIVIVICLIALLLGSVFGIFFANEGDSKTMTSVISEVNQEVYRKVETEQLLTRADEVVFDSTYSNWKEVIAIYSVKYSNDNTNSSIVMYLNDSNVSELKTIFYDFNTISTEIKHEDVDETYGDYQENLQTKQVKKNILHVKVESKTIGEIEKKYNFSDSQIKQVNELISSKYDSLWTSLIYGSGSGDYVYWRQKGSTWSNIQIGNSGKNIGNIGCLVTSVAILIQKSGVPTGNITPFNPGTFVEALNKNGGFDSDGNLQYSAINKVVPNFEYVGSVSLSGKNQNDKLKLINQYQSQGYFLAVEVKGDTGQHWVAVLSINGSNINMADPGSDATVMWNQYNWKNTSKFVYFRVK